MPCWRPGGAREKPARRPPDRNKARRRALIPQKRRLRVTHHQDRDGPLVETANETRQGPKGLPVLWVLGSGLVLALVAFLYFMTTSVENPPPDIGVTAP